MLRPSQHRRVNNDPTGIIARFRSPRFLPGGLPFDHRDNPEARHMTHMADSFDGTHHHTRHVKAPFLIAGLLAGFKRPPNHASPRLHHRSHPPAANARPLIQQQLISGDNQPVTRGWTEKKTVLPPNAMMGAEAFTSVPIIRSWLCVAARLSVSVGNVAAGDANTRHRATSSLIHTTGKDVRHIASTGVSGRQPSIAMR
ncbi:hypothetical protein BTHE_1760 [Bifidobacterium thermophilum]|nr:hypothetical protein BTHE_1760 [Bifidobacterium thermophilum]